MSVGETIENYLETLHILLQEQEDVRSVDLANAMNFSKPTISVMMKQLREKGLIKVDTNGFLSLTKKGRAIAERVYERHVYLTDLLIRLGVEEETAAEDACKIEHVISQETFDSIKKHFEEQE
ncbi:MAG: metal-dependent transcriptional regulator [Saccharofermentanales bacterium]